MIDYRVRSVSLLNLVNDVRSGRLIPDAYFQRNIVWREVHNKDFIKTILLGYPFPQIFISKGKVNVNSMSAISCIVDGQQRTNAIVTFIEGNFDVDGRKYSDFDDAEKSVFLKYEIAVIELEIENDDPKIIEIFQRINRTSNALTTIEKLASEYSTSEYMLTAKLLADQIDLDITNNDDFKEDPNIPPEFFIWAKKQKVKEFVHLITSKNIFTMRDIAKKANLMHVLNIMATVISDFYNRNEKANEFLNDLAFNFELKDTIIRTLNDSADFILKLKLKPKSYWYNKSNIFSLIIVVANRIERISEIDIDLLRNNLESFEAEIPPEYKLAASEGVNNKKERELRNGYIENIFDASKL